MKVHEDRFQQLKSSLRCKNLTFQPKVFHHRCRKKVFRRGFGFSRKSGGRKKKKVTSRVFFGPRLLVEAGTEAVAAICVGKSGSEISIWSRDNPAAKWKKFQFLQPSAPHSHVGLWFSHQMGDSLSTSPDDCCSDIFTAHEKRNYSLSCSHFAVDQRKPFPIWISLN